MLHLPLACLLVCLAHGRLRRLMDKYQLPYSIDPYPNPYIFDKDVDGPLPHLEDLWPDLDHKAQVVADAHKFLRLWGEYSDYFVPGYLHGEVPPELLQPFSEWIRSHGLHSLLPVLYIVVTGYGYGSFTDLPTLYALMYMTPELLLGPLDMTKVRPWDPF